MSSIVRPTGPIKIGTTPTYSTQQRKSRTVLLVMASFLQVAFTDSSFCIQGTSALQWGIFSRSSMQESWSSWTWSVIKSASLLWLKAKLFRYLKIPIIKYQRDKFGVSWLNLRIKCLKWYQEDPSLAKYNLEFLPGWISSILKRNNLVGVKLHGKVNEKTPEEEAALVVPWCVGFQNLLEYKVIDR